MGAYNYGLGNRDMAWAGYNALKREWLGPVVFRPRHDRHALGAVLRMGQGRWESSAWKKSPRTT